MSTLDARAASIRAQVADYRRAGRHVFATSSFQTYSVPLLHILSKLEVPVPVYFLDTGYHFPETLRFRDELAAAFDLRVVSVRPPVPKSYQRDAAGRLLYASDPEHCCHLNKVQPLEPVLAGHDVWISGVRADQSRARAAMRREEVTPEGVRRYHPMLEWNARDIYAYLRAHALPKHPLETAGYVSIGCEPCTRRHTTGERGGRWFGLQKSECGLHTELIKS
ncbi:MAG: phosphoadenylyl-sulfate reductase [Catalinimonas sp.]